MIFLWFSIGQAWSFDWSSITENDYFSYHLNILETYLETLWAMSNIYSRDVLVLGLPANIIWGSKLLNPKYLEPNSLSLWQSLTKHTYICIVQLKNYPNFQSVAQRQLHHMDLQNKNSNVCEFEIPLKAFKSQLVGLPTARFHKHLIVDLVLVDTC